MDLDPLAKKRKSVRAYKKKKVSWKQILEAINTTLQGPFAGNHNHMHFLIIEKEETINELASFCEQDWIQEAPIVVVILSDDTHLENIYGERGRVYSRQQAGAAIQTFMLKLTEFNLGSCWVGACDDHKVRDKLGVPHHTQIEAIIPVGYSNDKEEKKHKKELENVIYWEKWKQARRPTAFEEEKEDYRPQRFD